MSQAACSDLSLPTAVAKQARPRDEGPGLLAGGDVVREGFGGGHVQPPVGGYGDVHKEDVVGVDAGGEGDGPRGGFDEVGAAQHSFLRNSHENNGLLMGISINLALVYSGRSFGQELSYATEFRRS